MKEFFRAIKCKLFRCEDKHEQKHREQCLNMNNSLSERISVLMKIGHVALGNREAHAQGCEQAAYLKMFDSLYVELTEILEAREQNLLKCPLSDELKVSLADLRYLASSLKRDIMPFEPIIGVMGNESRTASTAA
jgi:hypothetical protein